MKALFRALVLFMVGLTAACAQNNPTFTGTVTFNNSLFAGSAVFPPSMLGLGTPSSTTVLYGDGRWRTPTGGGSSSNVFNPYVAATNGTQQLRIGTGWNANPLDTYLGTIGSSTNIVLGINGSTVGRISIAGLDGMNIGIITPAPGKFTTLQATNLDATPIGQVTPGLGTFTTLAATTLNATGGTLTGVAVKGLPTPTLSTDAVNKAYVDSIGTGGIIPKTSVRVATTANIASFSAVTVVDGVTLANLDRVEVKNQTTPAQNGIYAYTLSTTTLARATDADTAGELLLNQYYFVTAGTVNASTGWFISTAPTVLGTDPVQFSQFSASVTYTNGAGILLIGSQFSLDTSVAMLRAQNLADLASVPTARTNLGLGSMALQGSGAVSITGGAIDNVPIGGTTPNTGRFSTGVITSGSSASTLFSIINSSVGGHTYQFYSLGSASGTPGYFGLQDTTTTLNAWLVDTNARSSFKAIENTPIGQTTPQLGSFTNLSASGSAALTSLSVSGTATFASISASGAATLTSLSASGSAALTTLSVSGSAAFTTAIGISSTSTNDAFVALNNSGGGFGGYSWNLRTYAATGLMSMKGAADWLTVNYSTGATVFTTLSASSLANLRATKTNLNVGVNVKDYGAVGDGVTNDTAAINSAIAALTNYSTLLFPAGRYLITTGGISSLANLSYVRIHGNGAQLYSTTTGASGNFLVIDSTCSHIDIDNIGFVGSATVRGSGIGIRLYSSYSSVSKCFFSGMSDFAIHVSNSGAAYTQWVNIAENIIVGPLGDGIHVGNALQVTLTGNNISGTGDDGIGIIADSTSFPPSRITAVGNLIYNVGSVGIRVNEANDILVEANSIQNTVQAGIEVNRYLSTTAYNNRIHVKGNKLVNVITTLGPRGAILMNFCNESSVTENEIYDPANGSGISLLDFNDMVIRGNTIRSAPVRAIATDDTTTTNVAANWYGLIVDANVIQANVTNESIYVVPASGKTLNNLLITSNAGNELASGNWIFYNRVTTGKVGNNTSRDGRAVAAGGTVSGVTAFNNN